MNIKYIEKQRSKKLSFLKTIRTTEIIAIIKEYQEKNMQPLYDINTHIESMMQLHPEDISNLKMEQENINKEIKKHTIL
jgi:hypothetical protein